jgi:hypothetical protein
MYNSDDSAMMSRPTYNACERYPWAGTALAILTLLAMALVLAYLMASALQWRRDVRTQSAAAAYERLTWDRHDPAIARTVQVGALR